MSRYRVLFESEDRTSGQEAVVDASSEEDAVRLAREAYQIPEGSAEFPEVSVFPV